MRISRFFPLCRYIPLPVLFFPFFVVFVNILFPRFAHRAMGADGANGVAHSFVNHSCTQGVGMLVGGAAYLDAADLLPLQQQFASCFFAFSLLSSSPNLPRKKTERCLGISQFFCSDITTRYRKFAAMLHYVSLFFFFLRRINTMAVVAPPITTNAIPPISNHFQRETTGFNAAIASLSICTA